jgi:hypothetical protein
MILARSSRSRNVYYIMASDIYARHGARRVVLRIVETHICEARARVYSGLDDMQQPEHILAASLLDTDALTFCISSRAPLERGTRRRTIQYSWICDRVMHAASALSRAAVPLTAAGHPG